MDIMLERILSLIPRKQDGKFVHGALKEFANTVGLKSGNLVSDWMNGRSNSYKSYIYEISAKYNVSVEWLKGETDQKEKSPSLIGEGLSEEDRKHLQAFHAADEETKAAIILLLKKFERGNSL